MSIAPGWYKDPAEPTTQRWWDGEGWVGEPVPADATPPPGPPEERPPDHAPPGDHPAAPAGIPVAVPPSGQPATPASAPPTGSTAQRAAPSKPPRPHGYLLATLGARLLARLIDIGVVFVLNVAVNGWFVYQWVSEVSPVFREAFRRARAGDTNMSDLPQASDRSDTLLIVIVIIAAALWFAYEVPAVANSGQTPGKRLLGVKVVRLEEPSAPLSARAAADQPLGFGRSLRRWNPMGLPVLLWLCVGVGFVLQLLDAIFPLFDRPLQQALHDKYSHTVVVSLRSRHAGPEEEDEPDAPADPHRP